MCCWGSDVEHIPYRGFYCYAQSGSGYEDDDIPADLYYAGLDGTWNDDGDNKWGEPGEDDLLPEIGIGRFSFSNTTELTNMINKSVAYQNNPVLGEFRKALFAGEWLYSSPETWGSDYLELLIGYQNENGYETMGIPDDYDFQKLYEETTSWGANTLITAINSGKQYVHHVGHATQLCSLYGKFGYNQCKFYGPMEPIIISPFFIRTDVFVALSTTATASWKKCTALRILP
ncbi:MAG: C25 family cysteine peptidase [Bacteroidales bacterium]